MSHATWNFESRVAIVSGGAGGIGAAIVRKLAEARARVVFSDVAADQGEAFARQLCDAGAYVRFVIADARVESDVKRLVDTALNISAKLDIAINNVGGTAEGDSITSRVHDTDVGAWDGTFDYCLKSCFLAMKHELAPMLAAGSGAIVNISSLAGMRWTEMTSPAYAVAKSGVIHLTRYAALAYAKQGIRVNAVAPGITATPGVLRAFPDRGAADILAAEYHPMARMMAPEEIADACMWAASDASSGATGLVIPIDGGWAAR
jgi:NAD(P)-dependent dehydrogenase (short-subunit alcohol dehydrogenase family)